MFFNNLEILISRLFDPEFAHLLLQPLALYGLLGGLLFFIVGHYTGQPKCRMVALIFIALCALSVVPDLALCKKNLGQEKLARSGDSKLIQEQFQRRVDTKWVYYGLAICAAASLLGGGRLGAIANIAVIGGTIAVILFSAWLQMKDAEIYHPTIVKHAIPVR
jgi:hypothetical protein